MTITLSGYEVIAVGFVIFLLLGAIYLCVDAYLEMKEKYESKGSEVLH